MMAPPLGPRVAATAIKIVDSGEVFYKKNCEAHMDDIYFVANKIMDGAYCGLILSALIGVIMVIGNLVLQ